MTSTEYEKAIDLFADDVYRFALRCCGDRSRCDDAVQEAFAALWEHRDSVNTTDCKGFLFTVVRRKLIDSMRHDKVRLTAQSEMTVIGETASNPFESYELSDAIIKAFEQLPDMQRTVLTLHDIEGYDYREIAGIIGQKYKYVQVAAFRARMKMKQILTKYLNI